MTDPGRPPMRVEFYGTQGSGSIFPSRAERAAHQRRSEQELLTRIFANIAGQAGSDGRVHRTVEELVGGPVNAKTLAAYVERLDVPEPRVYGGWTTCVRIETADDYDIVLDCGSGFRNCAQDLQAKWADRPERHVHIFGSHSHLDHTEGFDQAAIVFDPRNQVHVYGNTQFLRALDYNLGIFSRQVASAARGVQTPIFFGVMPATFHACEIGGPDVADRGSLPSLHSTAHDIREPIRLGRTTITAFEVFHPAPCLAYRIEHGGRVMVFCTDHELRHGESDHPDEALSREGEARLVAHAKGADLLYRDGQYLRAEYDGLQRIGDSGAISRVGWGHSCIEDVLEMAAACDVKHTLIGHHDPNRGWSERNWIDESLARWSAGNGRRVELARAETVFDL